MIDNVVTTRLNELLGSHYAVMTYTWGCHWNVEGAGFKAAHDFLKELYEAEQERIDSTAERIRAIGGLCPATLPQMEQKTLISIPEESYATQGSFDTVYTLWKNLSTLWAFIIKTISSVHQAVPEEDIATRSFLENMSESMQKELWMINANIPVER